MSEDGYVLFWCFFCFFVFSFILLMKKCFFMLIMASSSLTGTVYHRSL